MTDGGFDARFAAMAPDERAAFVADLWAALGWETGVDGRVVVAERTAPTPETRRLLVADAGVEGDVDAVVAPDPAGIAAERGATAIDAADLRERLLYGADRAAARAVLRRHFDPGLAAAVMDTADAGGDGGSEQPYPDAADRGGGDPPDVTDGEDGEPPDVAASSGSDDRSSGAGGSEGPREADGSDAEDGRGTEVPEEPRDADGSRSARPGVPAAVLLVAVLGAAAVAGALAADVPGLAEPAPAPSGDGARYASLEPTCERPPALVIRIQLGAFRHNDELGDDRGIRVARRFASPANRRATGGEAAFVRLIETRYPLLLEHDEATFGPLRPAANGTDGRLVGRVTLRTAEGEAATFLWTVEKQEGGRYDGCWMTASVVRQPG